MVRTNDALQIQRYCDGEMEDRERLDFEARLETDRSLQVGVDEVMALRTFIAMPSPEDIPAISFEEVFNGVRTKLAQDHDAARDVDKGGLGWLRWVAVSMAAALVIAITGMFVVGQVGPSVDGPVGGVDAVASSWSSSVSTTIASFDAKGQTVTAGRRTMELEGKIVPEPVQIVYTRVEKGVVVVTNDPEDSSKPMIIWHFAPNEDGTQI